MVIMKDLHSFWGKGGISGGKQNSEDWTFVSMFKCHINKNTNKDPILQLLNCLGVSDVYSVGSESFLEFFTRLLMLSSCNICEDGWIVTVA